MIAFKNKQSIKDKYLKRVEAHYLADEIVQGIYWKNGKGGAVGCTLEDNGDSGSIHQKMEAQLGVPRQLAYLEDKIFEGLSNEDAKEFPLRFLKAIRVGADLSLIVSRLMIYILKDKKDGVWQYARSDGKKAITQVVKLYEQKLMGDEPSNSDWVKARNAAVAASDAAAAYAAADAAAYAAATASYAAYADDATASYAAYADAAAADAAYAATAAYAAADATAAYAARRKHYKKIADKLISLLKEA